MEEEIVAEFNKSGFALDKEEILKKCKPRFEHLPLNFLAMPLVQGNIFAVVGMVCCDGEGRQNEKVHHAAKQLTASGPFTTTENLLFEPLTELPAYADRKWFPWLKGKGEGGSTFDELKYHGTADKMNAWITIGI